MDTVTLLKLVEKAQEMALSNIWSENAYEINMEILKASHDNCPAYTRLAKYYKVNGDFEQAKNMYLKVLEIDPRHRGAINNLNEIELGQKEDEVVNKFETPKELFKEGQNSVKKGKYRLAGKLFSKAYSIEPLLIYAVNLAGVHKKMDRNDKVETLYRQLLEGARAKADIEAINNEFKTLLLDINLDEQDKE